MTGLDATAALPRKSDPGGAASLPFGTKGGPNAQSARQRLSKINGRDGAPPGSQDSGADAPSARSVRIGNRLLPFERDSQIRAASPQKWAPTEHRPPSLDWRCRADYAQGAAGSFANGGMTFALLAPCSLRPSGHLRCASSAPPGASVVSSQTSAAKRRLRVGKPSTAKSFIWGMRSGLIEWFGCQCCLRAIPHRPWSKNGSCEDADPRSLDWHGCANPSFLEKIITLFE